MPLNSDIKFQKALALAASASNQFEAEAAELAARRLMVTYRIDPTDIPDRSLYSRINFADNALLKKLRDEWRAAHPVVEPVVRQRSSELEHLDAIPFSLNGFSKYAHKKKKKEGTRETAVQLTAADYELIRVCLNDGWELKSIAELTDLKTSTINSTRAYHVRKGKWVRDSNGLLQWATGAANYSAASARLAP